jgi:hypothetical protein
MDAPAKRNEFRALAHLASGSLERIDHALDASACDLRTRILAVRD